LGQPWVPDFCRATVGPRRKLRRTQVPVQNPAPLDPLRKDTQRWVPVGEPHQPLFREPRLQADAEVVVAALASPFYAEPPPPVPPSCMLRFAAES